MNLIYLCRVPKGTSTECSIFQNQSTTKFLLPYVPLKSLFTKKQREENLFSKKVGLESGFEHYQLQHTCPVHLQDQ